MRFTGTESYVAPPDLTTAVNAAIVLERPLLVKGDGNIAEFRRWYSQFYEDA